MRPLRALLAGLLLCGAAAAAPGVPQHKTGDALEGRTVRDLHYGAVLFDYYQERYFDAIVGFNAARQVGRAGAHAADGELLLGGMLLAYGQHRQAARIFHALLENDGQPEVRDRAWFFLARLSFDRGATAQAQDAIARVRGRLPGRLEDERQMLAAQVLMASGRDQEAANALADWTGDAGWAAYAAFNRGVALVRAQRTDEGMKVLERAGIGTALDDESLAVRDRANLALGFAAVQAGNHEAARTAFRKMRLEGPWSSQALLGLGWAESALGNHRAALVPWQVLQGRDLLDPAVQESLLAVPYALMALGAHGQAAQGYGRAIASFDAESTRLEASIARIRSGAVIDTLLANDTPDSLGGNWEIDDLPASPETRYLLRLMAARGFQEGLKNLRDLRYVRANLQRWQQDLGAFSDMLATRRLRYAQHLPAVRETLRRDELAGALARREGLATRLLRAQQDGDPLALATTPELQQWQALEALDARIATLAPGARRDALHERARVLRGVLYWKLNHEQPARAWSAKQALAGIDDALAQAQSLRSAVAGAQSGEPARLAGFGTRIESQGPRVAALLRRTETLLARQQRALEDLAAAELATYRERLRAYASEAHFALAQVHDRAGSARGAAP